MEKAHGEPGKEECPEPDENRGVSPVLKRILVGM